MSDWYWEPEEDDYDYPEEECELDEDGGIDAALAREEARAEALAERGDAMADHVYDPSGGRDDV